MRLFIIKCGSITTTSNTWLLEHRLLRKVPKAILEHCLAKTKHKQVLGKVGGCTKEENTCERAIVKNAQKSFIKEF